MVINLDYMREWIGRIDVTTDRLVPVPVAGLMATLDRDRPPPKAGDMLPPLAHWLYFLSADRPADIGSDGQVRRGAFLPPVELPQCLWAGSRVQFHHPLHVGDTVTRTSSIVDISRKDGRSGPLVFVQVRHEIGNDDIAVTEDQDIVYRDHRRPGDLPAATRKPPGDAIWSRDVEPDEVMLFRYSALTFNAHRIHYDRDYAMDVEGYPGLVVQGPLVATLLLDLVNRHRPGATIASFGFRAVRPLFAGARFFLRGQLQKDGKTAKLWAESEQGYLAMDAVAGFG